MCRSYYFMMSLLYVVCSIGKIISTNVIQGKVTLETGIKTEKWWDCHYIPALDATVTAEWYFTGTLE